MPESEIVQWSVVFFMIVSASVFGYFLHRTPRQTTRKTMPCYDCQKPIPFSYCFDGSIGWCFACEKKVFDAFQARMLPSRKCSACGECAATQNNALCWRCLTVNTPQALTVYFPTPVTMAQTHKAPTRLYSLESGVRNDA